MSSSASASRGLPLPDPRNGMVFSVATLLIPLFKTAVIDSALAVQIAASAIDAYDPQTRADFVNIARTIAFSIASLTLLGKAMAEDVTTAEQMRTFSRANAVNRSADQSERTMMQRRRLQKAEMLPEQPDASPEPTLPDADIDNVKMEAAIAGVMKECRDACRAADVEDAADTTAAVAPQRAPFVSPVQALPAMPALPIVPPLPTMPALPGLPGLPTMSAAEHPRIAPLVGSGGLRMPPSYKDTLLQDSVMQRGVARDSAQPGA